MNEVLEIGGNRKLAQTTVSPSRHITNQPQTSIAQMPSKYAPAATTSDEGHPLADLRRQIALVGNLSMETRRYTDLRRAYQRLDLQAKAMCRYACNGDKGEGAKLHITVMKDECHPLRVWLMPYLQAMAPLEKAIKQQEKVISSLARQLPIKDWVAEIAGLSERFVGLIVGECGSPPGEFRNPSCLWKRMGLAVIDGGRQRKVCGDAALEHGYVARRRALMWNIGESIIKQQVRKGEDGVRRAIGELGQVYIDRRAYLEARDGADASRVHTNAKRYMEKRLLRQLWQAWRASGRTVDFG